MYDGINRENNCSLEMNVTEVKVVSKSTCDVLNLMCNAIIINVLVLMCFLVIMSENVYNYEIYICSKKVDAK